MRLRLAPQVEDWMTPDDGGHPEMSAKSKTPRGGWLESERDQNH